MKVLNRAWSWAPGTWGELVQGEQDGRRLLVSLPSHRGTVAQASLSHRQSRLPSVICSEKYKKARSAVQLLLNRLGESQVQVRIQFSSVLQPGVGHASSSADVLSALQATLKVLQRRIPPAFLCNIASRVEPTNPTILPGACLFDPDNGVVIGRASLPVFDVLPLACGGSVDTIKEKGQRPRWKNKERAEFNRILEMMRNAVGAGSLQQLAQAATRSAFLHAERHSRADIWPAWKEAQRMGALGIAASHSGSSVVALMARKGVGSHV